MKRSAHRRNGSLIALANGARLPDRKGAIRIEAPRRLVALAVSGSTAKPLRVLALGPLRVFVGDDEVEWTAGRSGKSALVLKYLLTREPGHPFASEAVMEALWSGQDPARSGQCLRAAVSALRHNLQPDLPSRMPSAYLRTRGGCLSLSLGEGGFFDVAEFAQQVQLALELERGGRAAEGAKAYRAAIALYRGEFLEEERYAEWAFPLRDRLQGMYTTALVRLAAFCLGQGDTAQATELAGRAIQTEEALEPAFLLLIACFRQTGQWGRQSPPIWRPGNGRNGSPCVSHARHKPFTVS